MSLPTLNHRTYNILYLLWHGEESGIRIRMLLREEGWEIHDPHFYRDTKLLEQQGLIETSQYSVREGGRNFQRKKYRLTDAGRRRVREQADFYKKLKPPT